MLPKIYLPEEINQKIFLVSKMMCTSILYTQMARKIVVSYAIQKLLVFMM